MIQNLSYISSLYKLMFNLTFNNISDNNNSLDSNLTKNDGLTDIFESFEDWDELDFSKRLQLSLRIIWSVIIVVGVSANGCVLYTMLFGSRLTSTTHYFIVNLAMSDLLFLLLCPTLTLISYDEVQFSLLLGQFVCKIVFFLTQVTAYITCLTLMSMTFDRYIVIVYPLKSLAYRTKKKAIAINVFIWTISCLLSLPHSYYRYYEYLNGTGYCANSVDLYEIYVGSVNLDQFFQLYTVIIAYAIPLCTIIWCYSIMIMKLCKEKKLLNDASKSQVRGQQKKRHRVLIMIALVTLLFGLSWLPIHCIHIAYKFFQNSFPIWNKSLFIFKAFAHTLTYTNSMLNPFFYTITGNNFQQKLCCREKKTNIARAYYFSRLPTNDTSSFRCHQAASKSRNARRALDRN